MSEFNAESLDLGDLAAQFPGRTGLTVLRPERVQVGHVPAFKLRRQVREELAPLKERAAEWVRATMGEALSATLLGVTPPGLTDRDLAEASEMYVRLAGTAMRLMMAFAAEDSQHEAAHWAAALIENVSGAMALRLPLSLPDLWAVSEDTGDFVCCFVSETGVGLYSFTLCPGLTCDGCGRRPGSAHYEGQGEITLLCRGCHAVRHPDEEFVPVHFDRDLRVPPGMTPTSRLNVGARMVEAARLRAGERGGRER